jgi:hypothetical protein
MAVQLTPKKRDIIEKKQKDAAQTLTTVVKRTVAKKPIYRKNADTLPKGEKLDRKYFGNNKKKVSKEAPFYKIIISLYHLEKI